MTARTAGIDRNEEITSLSPSLCIERQRVLFSTCRRTSADVQLLVTLSGYRRLITLSVAARARASDKDVRKKHQFCLLSAN